MAPTLHPLAALNTRHLALCADDFGLHDSINRTVVALAHTGRITAVSGMVAAPAWQQSHAVLRELDGTRVDIGLHLDLTEYTLWPGQRRSLPALIAAAYTGMLTADRVHDEITAQLDTFEAALGRAPSHVDGHRHVHQLPTIRDALIDILQRRYPAQRPWVRVSLPARLPADGWVRSIKPGLIGRLGGRSLLRLLQIRRHLHNTRLLGVYGFEADTARYQRLLACWLHAARSGDLLMCHPAIESRENSDPIADARRCEYSVLASAAFADLLADNAITLARMSRILAGTEVASTGNHPAAASTTSLNNCEIN